MAFGYTDAIREHVFVDSRLRQRRGRRQRPDRGRHHPPGGHRPGPEGAGDHGRRARTTRRSGAATSPRTRPHRRRRARRRSCRCSSTTTSSRAATPSSSSDMTARTSRPAARRPGRPGDLAGPEGGDRLAQRPPPGARRERQPSSRADWHNGKTGMIGKSYDGTLANGRRRRPASTGLTTIVPISAISDYYDYTRTNGDRAARQPLPRRQLELAREHDHGRQPARRADALPADRGTRSPRSDGDANGDYNAVLGRRDYLKDARQGRRPASSRRTASNDENVRLDHFGKWWAGLAANNVPRKLWLSQEGHVDPFDYRRAVVGRHAAPLVRLLAPGRPQRDHERARGHDRERRRTSSQDYADWPLPGTAMTDVYLRSGTAAAAPGGLGAQLRRRRSTRATFTDANLEREQRHQPPTGSQANRLAVPLAAADARPARLGHADVDIQASSRTRRSRTSSAFLVDYGAEHPRHRTSDGVATATNRAETCWGDCRARPTTPCYNEMTKPHDDRHARGGCTKGMLDSSNRDSLTHADADHARARSTRSRWPMLPNDFTFTAGHQIGIVHRRELLGLRHDERHDRQPQITVDTKRRR